jgi:hypothetical protein
MKIEPVEFLCTEISQPPPFPGNPIGELPWFEVKLLPVSIQHDKPWFAKTDTGKLYIQHDKPLLFRICGSPGFFIVGRRYSLTIGESK